MLDAKQQTKNSYPHLANFNVQWFRFDFKNLNEMGFDEHDRIEFELRNGDLLITSLYSPIQSLSRPIISFLPFLIQLNPE